VTAALSFTPAAIDRFWLTVDKTQDCWAWTGWLNKDGYGHFKFKGSRTAAHRVSYQLAFGPIAANQFVCHRCDNRKCVRPDHLFVGNHQANMRDMVLKNRSVFGEQHRSAKLDERDVWLIKRLSALGVGQRELGQAFGVATSTVAHIVTGRTWSRVDPSLDANNVAPDAAP
jgi:hypothetical protein